VNTVKRPRFDTVIRLTPIHRFLPLLLLLLAGCRDREVVFYEVPKETRSTPTAPQADQLPPSAPPTPFHFDAPANWVEQPASAMRLASYQVPGESAPTADFSIIALPGSAGGALANVNRWRGQIGLAPLSPTELAESAVIIESGHYEYQIFEMISEDPILEGNHRARVIAAILEHDGTTWFFKMTGEDEVVTAEKAAFKGLLRSFHLDEAP
jgi:hypothetical protein